MQKMHILSNSAKFLLVSPYFHHINFLATMAMSYSTYRLGPVASLKFMAIENMTPHFSTYVCYGKTAGWIRIPLWTALATVC